MRQQLSPQLQSLLLVAHLFVGFLVLLCAQIRPLSYTGCLNVCFALQQKSLDNTRKPNNPAYDQFKPGTFVLLRKKSVQPRHMIKANRSIILNLSAFYKELRRMLYLYPLAWGISKRDPNM